MVLLVETANYYFGILYLYILISIETKVSFLDVIVGFGHIYYTIYIYFDGLTCNVNHFKIIVFLETN